MKKTIIFTAVLLAFLFPPLWAQNYKIKQNADNTVTITDVEGTPELYYLEIPSTLYGLKVTAIGDKVFMGIFGLYSIAGLEIPDTVTSIGADAFYSSQLIGLIIPSTVRRIGAGAFGGRPIYTVVIPASLSPGTNGQLGESYKGAFEGDYYERADKASITLPAGMDTNVVKNNFGVSLSNYYVSQGKTAGTYVKNGPIWVKAQSASARTYFDSGKAKFDKGDYFNAVADFIQAVQLDPNNSTYKETRKNAQKRYIADRLLEREADRITFSSDTLYYNALIKNYSEAIRLSPDYAKVYAKRAETYLEKGDLDKAIDDYAQAVQFDPNNSTYKEALRNAQEKKVMQTTIGGRGPAGGIIFYDKGNKSGGWQYLEAAPEDIRDECIWRVEYVNVDAAGIKRGIGSGKQNTKLITTGEERSRYRQSAAYNCINYSRNGYRDWFLPSIDELKLMYENLHMKGLGNFQNYSYWSSSSDDGEYGFILNFGDNFGAHGGVFRMHFSSDNNRVRPIRAF